MLNRARPFRRVDGRLARRCAVFAAALLGILIQFNSRPARGASQMMHTLEGNIMEYDFVLLGHIDSVSQAGSAKDFKLNVNVVRVFKGPSTHPKTLEITIHKADCASASAGFDLLICFEANGNPATVDQSKFTSIIGRADTFYLLDGERVDSLTPVRNLDGRPIRTRDELFEAVKETVAAVGANDTGATTYIDRRSLPTSVEAQLPPGIRCVQVPAGPVFDARIRDWTQRPGIDFRIAGANLMSRRKPIPGNIAALQRLMLDPEFEERINPEWSADTARRAVRFFPARAAAAAAVRKLAGELPLSQPPQLAAIQEIAFADGLKSLSYPAYSSPSAWRAAAFFVTPCALLLLARRRGGRIGLSGWGAIGCALLLVLAGLLCWRGSEASDTVSFAVGGTDWEITTTLAGVNVLSVSDGAPAHGPVVRAGMKQNFLAEAWYRSMLTPSHEWNRMGFAGSAGKIAAEESARPFHRLQIPWAALLLALGLWPGWMGLTWMGRTLRTRHWRGNGRCAHCGYDQRGSTPGRCSECGGFLMCRCGATVVSA